MTYNAAPRRRFTAHQREAFLVAHDGRCYWCGLPIKPGQPWDIEHKTARELLPDASADADDNLAPIHSHPSTCHKIKTALDRKIIAKSNRVQRKHGPVEDRRQTRNPIRSRPMGAGSTKIPSRPFDKPKSGGFNWAKR